MNGTVGLVQSESLSGATTYTLTLTNSSVVSTSVLIVTPYTGSSTTAELTNVTPGSGSVMIAMKFSAAFTGILKIPFLVSN